MNKTITNRQAQRLESIKKESIELDKKLNSLYKEAMDITQEDNESGRTFDFVYNNFGELEVLLSHLGISVK